ncbi:MAG: hypothetical protein PHG27_06005 [Massilibacteroides sp.]|nr:hypothetical protein [Massilibacteroides sp.]
MKTFTQLRTTFFAVMLFAFSAPLFSQEESEFQIAPAADIVSSYVWRGIYQTGPSFQPSINASWKGLSLTAWGSTDFSTVDNAGIAKEFDFTLSYSTGGVSLAVTDYWWAGEGSRYGDYSGNHFFEGTIGYHFGESFPLGITWNTMLGMDGDKDADGDQQYSTYVEAGYDFNVSGVDLTASVGVSPWAGIYHKEGKDGFALSTISLKASKSIKITDSFSLPIFAQTIIAPNHDNVFLVFGVTIE